MEDSKINVCYECVCGNTEDLNPRSNSEMYQKNCMAIDTALRYICLKCGKDMKVRVSETVISKTTTLIY